MNRRIGIIILSVILILIFSLYAFQDKIIFRAVKLDKEYAFQFTRPFTEYSIATPDSNTINLLWFHTNSLPKGIVFYFHGNAGNLQRWGNYTDDLTRLGYEVVMMDYRGYGKSTGAPSEQNLYEDSELIYRWSMTQKHPKRIIIYGRSLGTPVATQLAAKVQPELLILETPFDELKGVLPEFFQPLQFFLRHTFPTREFITHVNGKKIIFHGTSDNVVPLRSALRLKPLIKSSDEFIIIEGGNHRNLRTYEIYQQKLTEALQ
jgi:uncharacterized protein